MLRFFPFLVVLFFCTRVAQADDRRDCYQSNDVELAMRACNNIAKADAKGKRASKRRPSEAEGEELRPIADYSRAIERQPTARNYFERGKAYAAKKDYDSAIADFNRAIELQPNAVRHGSRARAHAGKMDYPRAIADYSKAIELGPSAFRYAFRGRIYQKNGEHERALADYKEALELEARAGARVGILLSRARLYFLRGDFDAALQDLASAIEDDPGASGAYALRGNIYGYRGELNRGLEEVSRALQLDAENSNAYAVRARILLDKGDLDGAQRAADQAIAMHDDSADAFVVKSLVLAARGQVDPAIDALTKAIELDPKNGEAYSLRADLLLKKGSVAAATSDFKQVLSLQARRPRERDAQMQAAERLTSLTKALDAAKPGLPPGPVTAPAGPVITPIENSGPRVALVIGNARYTHAGELKNPGNDARTVASTLRQIGFTEIIEKYDLGLSQMTSALKEFGDRAANASWAVIYFAGHGLEMGGVGYLVPTDAKIEKDAHVPDETIPLDRMLQKTESAKRLRLVILDACRNNPFLTRMTRTVSNTRSLGRGGLPAIEVEGDVLVAYATKHGTVALDGSGDNSPYAQALADHLVTPNTDIRVMFGKVRDTVRKTTNNRQDPYTYGSIGGDLHFFVSAVR